MFNKSEIVDSNQVVIVDLLFYWFIFNKIMVASSVVLEHSLQSNTFKKQLGFCGMLAMILNFFSVTNVETE
jgi:hypothetical protein